MKRAPPTPRRPRLLPVKVHGAEPGAVVPHKGPVQAVCADKGGRWALSGGKDGVVRAFDVAKGTCFGEWDAHDGGVWALAALEGDRAASAGHDHTVKIWDIPRQSCLAVLKGHEDFVYRLTNLAGGRALASAGADRTIRIWDLERRSCIRTLVGHSRLVSGLCAVGGRHLLSASADQSLRLWDLERGVCDRTLLGHRQDVLGLAVSPDARRAATTSADGELRLWELLTGECVGSAHAHDGSAEHVRMLSGGGVMTAGWDGRLRWWAGNARPTKQLSVHKGAVRGLDSAPKSRYLFSGGLDAVVRALELRSGRAVSRWEGPGPVSALAAIDTSAAIVGFATGDAAVLRLQTPGKAKPKPRKKKGKR